MSTLLPIHAVQPVARRVVFEPALSDADLESLCLANELMQFERTREGVILMNPPAGMLTGDANAEIIRQLRNWWFQHRRGRVFDSNTGFYLPDGSMLSPDAAYASPKTLAGLRTADLMGFGRLCPDFVVELLSASDRRSETEEKMERWIENGATLAWLVDPYQREVLLYAPGISPRPVRGSDVQGTGPVQGFVLDVSEVWRAYAEE